MFDNYKDSFLQKYFTYVGIAPIQMAFVCIILPIMCNTRLFPLFVLYILCISISMGLYYYLSFSTYGTWETLQLLIDEKKITIEEINRNRKYILTVNCITAIIVGFVSGKLVVISNGDEMNITTTYCYLIGCLFIPVMIKSHLDRHIYHYVSIFLDMIFYQLANPKKDISKEMFIKMKKLELIRGLTTFVETVICIIPAILIIRELLVFYITK